MRQRTREEAEPRRPQEPATATRPLGGGYGEEPVRVADLEAWARRAGLRVT